MLALLDDYLQRYPAEQEMVCRYICFVEQHENCFERSLLIGHVTGSAFIVDQAMERVLLTHHRKLDRWLQPGGHADGEPDVSRVALMEAREESGLPVIEFVTRELLDVDIHAIPARNSEPGHEHFDCRFLLKAVGSDSFTVSDESHDLAWVALDQITDYTDDGSILRMIDKARLVLG